MRFSNLSVSKKLLDSRTDFVMLDELKKKNYIRKSIQVKIFQKFGIILIFDGALYIFRQKDKYFVD